MNILDKAFEQLLEQPFATVAALVELAEADAEVREEPFVRGVWEAQHDGALAVGELRFSTLAAAADALGVTESELAVTREIARAECAVRATHSNHEAVALSLLCAFVGETSAAHNARWAAVAPARLRAVAEQHMLREIAFVAELARADIFRAFESEIRAHVETVVARAHGDRDKLRKQLLGIHTGNLAVVLRNGFGSAQTLATWARDMRRIVATFRAALLTLCARADLDPVSVAAAEGVGDLLTAEHGHTLGQLYALTRTCVSPFSALREQTERTIAYRLRPPRRARGRHHTHRKYAVARVDYGLAQRVAILQRLLGRTVTGDPRELLPDTRHWLEYIGWR